VPTPDRTVRYYDDNAEAFVQRTGGIDMSDLYEPFLALVPDGGRILDAGCGSGRDALVFARRGYDVTALDASAAMVAVCRAAGLRAVRATFDGFEGRGAFDGIWASASLLHVRRARLAGVIRHLCGALREGGAFYMSFKQGEREEWRDGRLFADQTPESVAVLLDGIAELRTVRIWTTTNRQDAARPPWTNALAIRSPASA
jgi:SAM-dependent methyltransferase